MKSQRMCCMRLKDLRVCFVRKYTAFLNKKDGDTGSAVCNTRFAKVYDNQG